MSHIWVAFSLAGLVAFAAPARADESSAVKDIARLNHEALEQYDLLEFEAAKAKLLEAVQIAEREGLVEDRMLARTYLHLGAVYIAGFKDFKSGDQALLKALRIDSGIKMTPSIKARAVLQAYDRARAALAAERAAVEAKIAETKRELSEKQAAERARMEKLAAQKAAERAARDAAARRAGEQQVAAERARREEELGEKPAAAQGAGGKTIPPLADALELENVEGLKCPAAPELPARRPLALRCVLDKTVDAAVVFAFYRPIGRDDFTPQIMRKSPKGWWEAVLGGEYINSPGIEIYFEARDKKGKPLAADGNAAAPKTMTVKTASSIVRVPGRVMAKQAP